MKRSPKHIVPMSTVHDSLVEFWESHVDPDIEDGCQGKLHADGVPVEGEIGQVVVSGRNGHRTVFLCQGCTEAGLRVVIGTLKLAGQV